MIFILFWLVYEIERWPLNYTCNFDSNISSFSRFIIKLIKYFLINFLKDEHNVGHNNLRKKIDYIKPFEKIEISDLTNNLSSFL